MNVDNVMFLKWGDRQEDRSDYSAAVLYTRFFWSRAKNKREWSDWGRNRQSGQKLVREESLHSTALYGRRFNFVLL